MWGGGIRAVGYSVPFPFSGPLGEASVSSPLPERFFRRAPTLFPQATMPWVAACLLPSRYCRGPSEFDDAQGPGRQWHDVARYLFRHVTAASVGNSFLLGTRKAG